MDSEKSSVLFYDSKLMYVFKIDLERIVFSIIIKK